MIVPLTVLGLYLPYAVFEDVSYLRFLLPGLPFLFALAAGVVVALTARFPPSLGAALTIVAALMAGATNIAEARHQQAFDLERLERRYLTVGRFVADLPPEGVIVLARQHSGSLAHYTHAPILRWDLVDADGLDAALALAGRERRRLLIVVDEVEIADFRARFATYASLGRLAHGRCRPMTPASTTSRTGSDGWWGCPSRRRGLTAGGEGRPSHGGRMPARPSEGSLRAPAALAA